MRKTEQTTPWANDPENAAYRSAAHGSGWSNPVALSWATDFAADEADYRPVAKTGQQRTKADRGKQLEFSFY
jgi:hypothetical protein